MTQQKPQAIHQLGRNTTAAQLANNSVPNPSAQIYKVCKLQYNEESTLANPSMQLDTIQLKDLRLQIILELLSENGCRISEILNIKHSDITGKGQIHVKGLKGSNDNIIFSAKRSAYFKDCRKEGVHPFSGINRFYVYREFKKMGISQRFGNNINASVTHLPRHLLALDSLENNIPRNVRSQQLGHKIERTTKHYEVKPTE